MKAVKLEEEQVHNHDHSNEGHNHKGHSHRHPALNSENKTKIGASFKFGLIITLVFVGLEFGAGLVANSLALISDAGHNLSDALALGFSWLAVIIAARAPTITKTYGYHRATILAASLNALTLVLVAGYVLFEGVSRLFNPPPVQSWITVGVATVALLVNLALARMLHAWSHGDLNARSAYLHLITDAAASVGVILAGLGQVLTGWQILDPLISIVIGLLILWSSWGIIKEATNILLEGSPANLDVALLLEDLKGLDGVDEVHDLHVWTISSNLPTLSCHLQMQPSSTFQQATQTVQFANRLLEQKYQIRHSTIQVEGESCQPTCQMHL